MLTIQKGVSLRPYNTFRIDSTAQYLVEIDQLEDLQALLIDEKFRNTPKLVLGGGSNLLLTQNVEGLVIKINILGINVVREDDYHVYLEVGAGVNWHELVMYCVDNGLAGMENLSLIPGTVGAAPMQNIGAYGVEIEQIFDSLTAVHVQSGALRHFTHADCQFGYRESVFKRSLKGQYIITSVTFRLSKKPTFHTQYGAIQETLNAMGISGDTLSIKAISEAVIHIRRSKLPDPAEIGNAGSFFKNPEIQQTQFDQLKSQYPALPGYPTGPDTVKVPAGWLIEQSGWKGRRVGDAGVHAKQALVLVNYGQATGHEIVTIAQQVQRDVAAIFGIQLTPEVNII